MTRRFDLSQWLAVAAILAVGAVTTSRADTLLHYDFGNGSGATVTDLSGHGNDGTLVDFDDTSAGAGQFGQSEGWVTGGGLSFRDDGVRSYVETLLPLNSLGLPDGGNISHTIEFLASYGVSQGWTPVIGSDQSPTFSAPEAFFFGINDNTTLIELRTPGPGGNITGAVGLHPWQATEDSSSTMHHLAFVYDYDSDELETFVDGESVDLRTTGFTLDMGQTLDGNVFRIGNAGHAAGEQWGGVMKGTAISSSTLTADNFVLTNGNQPSTVLHYDYSEGSGTTVTDLSGSGNDGDLVDFLDTSAGAGEFNTSEGWVAGGGLSFLDDAQRNYVETPLEVFQLDESFTIEVMTNYANPAGWSPFVGSSQDPFSDIGTMFVGINDVGTNLHFRGPGYVSDLTEHPWRGGGDPEEADHHIAVRYDEATGEAEVLVDGLPLGTVDRSDADYGFAESMFRIGNVGWSDAEQWDGVIRGIAISDAYLDPEEFVLIQSSLEGDYNDNGELDAGDLDLQAVAIAGGEHPPEFDLNGDSSVDFTDRQMWVNDLKNSWIGDANLDLEFNSGDMVQVFVKGKYETGEDAKWEEGDWNGDVKFGSGDMVAAFAAGGYEQGKRPVAAVHDVPEPASLALAWIAIVGLFTTCRGMAATAICRARLNHQP